MELRASIEVWQRVLQNPTEEVYREELERPYANMSTAVIWLFAAGMIAVLVWLLIFLLLDPFSQSLEFASEFWAQFGLSEAEVAQMTTQMEEAVPVTMFFMLCSLFFGIPLLTILWSGFLYVVAKVLDGTGSFEKQTFLIAAIVTPLTILSVILYIVPFLGLVLVIAFGLYMVYLTYFAMRAVHGLNKSKATTAVLTPIVVMVVVACCGSILWLMLLSASLGSLA